MSRLVKRMRRAVGLAAAPRVRKSYAHCGEDLVLRSLLKSQRDGYYVDIGCHHPVEHSTTYLFAKRYGWRGLAVDADPTYLPLFARYRPRDIAVQVGIGAEAGRAQFFRVAQDAALNTFSPVVADALRARGCTVTASDVEVLPLAALLARERVDHIDLLNVDVEGLDLTVLQSNDWSRWRPRLIAVEDHGIDLDQPERSATFRYLREQHYHLRAKCLYTSIYERAEPGAA